MREPTRKFLAPNGRIVNKPLRDLPAGSGTLQPSPEQLEEAERVADATSLCDEPEFPSGAIIDAYRDLGRTFDRLRHAADVEQREQNRAALMEAVGPAIALEHRMVDARRRARMQGVDVSRELHVMRKDLERARNGGREPTAVARRMASLEARLDHRPDLDQAA